MQKNNTSFVYRISILAAGFIFLILPQFTKENEFIYVLSPWIYLSCFLFFSRTMEKKLEWILFGIVMLAGYEIRYRDFLGDSEASLGTASIGLLVVLTVGFLIPFLCDKLYLSSEGRPLAFVIFPLMRLLVEHVIYGQQFKLSVTQFGNKWLIQSEALFGDNFVSFFVALVPSVITYMLVKRKKQVLVRGSIYLLLVVLVFGYGMVRYNNSRNFRKTVRMAYASGPQKAYYEVPSEDNPDYDENIRYLKRTVKEAAEGGAGLIAYAEEAFFVTGYEEHAGLIEEAEAAAKENQICILLSIDFFDGTDLWENKAVLIDSEGYYQSDYIKTNLIPVVEDGDYQAGDGIIPCNHVQIDGENLVISYTICYDGTFSEYLLTMDKETQLHINPSWDWAEIVDLNYRMQGISAIQAGVVLFKPTVDGWSTVMDPYGKLSYKVSTLRQDYNKVYFADVPFGRARSLYKKLAKFVYPIWSSLVLIALLELARVSIWRFRKRFKKNPSPAA